jgi:16S rRNA G966 N2-methylase RsmD
MSIYATETQKKNLAWLLPRPKPDCYKGGMPLYAEKWCLQLARDILDKQDASIVNPDLLCDVHELSKHLDRKFDIIFADPPYSNQEARDIYGTPNLRYKVWTAEATKCLNDGGLLIVYHKHLVGNPDLQVYRVVRRVTVMNRVGHPPRVAVYFQLK